MMSRRLLCSIAAEDLKQRVWTIALTAISFIFAVLVPTAMAVGVYRDAVSMGAPAFAILNAQNEMFSMLTENGFAALMLVVLAVVWAVSGFAYLFDRRKVDFYHSIPVKREVLFLAGFINGFVIPGILFTLAKLVGLVMILNTGTVTGTFLAAIAAATFREMVYFLAIYSICILAVMLTGNLVVSGLACMTLLGYGPLVLSLKLMYMDVFFDTFVQTDEMEQAFTRWCTITSPVAGLITRFAYLPDPSLDTVALTASVVMAVVSAVLSLILYRMRASEAAGNAIAFPKIRQALKFVIMIPMGILGGMFLYSIRKTIIWGVFGGFSGAFLTAVFMEIIYALDFKKLFQGVVTTAAGTIIVVLLMVTGIRDLWGYDSYLPDRDKIAGAAIHMGWGDSWVDYGYPELTTNYNGEKYYNWRYQNQNKILLNHTEQDIDRIRKMAELGIRADKNLREDPTFESEYTMEHKFIRNTWTNITVHYVLKNGRNVYRKYRLPLDAEALAAKNAVYDTENYHKALYPILSLTPEEVAGVYTESIYEVSEVKVEAEKRSELLAMYQKELDGLLAADRAKELPIGKIQFRRKTVEEAIAFNTEAFKKVSTRLGDHEYYPIYPSFTGTLALLKEAGWEPTELSADIFSKGELTYFFIDYSDAMEDPERMALNGENRVLTQEELKELIPAMVSSDYEELNQEYEYHRENNAVILCTFGTPRKGSFMEVMTGEYAIDLDRLTPEVIRKYHLSSENVSQKN